MRGGTVDRKDMGIGAVLGPPVCHESDCPVAGGYSTLITEPPLAKSNFRARAAQGLILRPFQYFGFIET